MTEIVSTRLIPQNTAAVFAAAQQVERFPAVLPDVDSVNVLEDDGAGHVVTKWRGTISVGPLTRQIGWTERDTWDAAAQTCTFELVEGDMKQYSGVWTFSPQEGGTLVELRVRFELGIPLLGALVNRIVDQIMQRNCDDLLEALEQLSAV
jgi:ribosome-associated toxin RatA of RatAB toxin-antitoxin module